jgi:putative pyruvate formate lyase activating enzyme
VNRNAGEKGFCGETAELRIGTAVIHCGEEPPLVGFGGSGTIFISGCNLGCTFCQNYQISRNLPVSARASKDNANLPDVLGKAVSPQIFADICEALRSKGAENINIVTGSHVIPKIIEGFDAWRKTAMQTMPLPVLWNCSAYENTDALELLRDYVDLYLPDLKTLDSGIANRFFNAPDYPETAAAAILKMVNMTEEKANPSVYDDMCKRVIIRHLILPGHLESTREVLRWFAENIKGRAMLSLMTQYTPIPGKNELMPKRYVVKEEYDTVLNWLEEFEIEDGFCQELVTGSDWLPDFKRPNPFTSKLSVPVWSSELPAEF